MPQSGELTTSGGQYRSLRRLATGGMGEVEVAVREAGVFRRLYAVKRLKSELIDDDNARTMFLDEARVSGMLRHPNVVSVLDVGVDERGPYLVMDYVEGLSLSQILGSFRARERQLPLQVCLRIAHQVALGLHAAHELRGTDGQSLQLVHRDVSPQNVLIGFDGVTRLTDFGIAKAQGRSTHTTTGLLKGKVGYMSPEQLRFEEPDRRSDLFSFGVVLFEMVSGRRLYREDHHTASARRILNEPPPDIDDERDDVPPTLVDLLFRLLAKDPDVRPNDARAVAAVLDELISDLVSNEGRKEVSDFMKAHYSGHAEKVRQSIEELLDSPEATAPRAPALGTMSKYVEPVEVSPSSRKWYLAVIVLLSVIVVTAGTMVAMRSGGERASETQTQTASETQTETETAPETQTASETQTQTASETQTETASEAEAETQTASETETAPATAATSAMGDSTVESSPSRPAMRRRSMARGRSMSMDRLFEWN